MNIGPGATLTTNLWTTGTAGTTNLDFNGGTLKAGITGSLLGASNANSATIVLYGTGGTINSNGVATNIFSTVTNATGSGVTALTVGIADASTVFTVPPKRIPPVAVAQVVRVTRHSMPAGTSTAW